MLEVVTLSCPSCGGKLQVTSEIDRFACGHCGNEHLVRREGGLIYLAPLMAGISQIRTGVDRTAAELAVVRLSKEVKELQADLDIALNTTVPREFPPPQNEKNFRVLIAFVFLGGTLFGFQNGSGFLLMASWAIGAVFMIIALRVATKRLNHGKAVLDEHIQETKRLLGVKRKALAQNQRLLDG